MKLLFTLARAGFLLVAALALVGIGLGRALPGGERYGYTFMDGFDQSAYLMDTAHRLSYPLDWGIVNQFAINPANPDEIAFSILRDENWDVYIGNPFTGETRRLTDDPYFDWQPTWSPDGSRIAFVSSRTGNMKLYAVEAGGGWPRWLVNGSQRADSPVWSPDGAWIAFVNDDGGRVQVYAAEVDCVSQGNSCIGDALPLTSSARADYLPAWSPDGKSLAFVSDRGGWPGVYVLNLACLDSGDCTRQNARQLKTAETPYRIDDLQWAGDGRTIRMVAYVQGGWGVYTLEAGCDLLPEGCRLHWLAGR